VESIDDQLSDVMDIRLSAHYVRDHLDGKDPFSRHITMRSYNKFRELKTTFYFNSENICPPNLAQCFQCDGRLLFNLIIFYSISNFSVFADKEMVKERTYHSWIYRKIRSLK